MMLKALLKDWFGSDSTVTGDSNVSLKSFFSDLTYNEIHLFWMGLYTGFVAIKPRPKHKPKKPVRDKLKWNKNAWYWEMGFVVGYLIKVGVAGYGAKTVGLGPL